MIFSFFFFKRRGIQVAVKTFFYGRWADRKVLFSSYGTSFYRKIFLQEDFFAASEYKKTPRPLAGLRGAWTAEAFCFTDSVTEMLGIAIQIFSLDPCQNMNPVFYRFATKQAQSSWSVFMSVFFAVDLSELSSLPPLAPSSTTCSWSRAGASARSCTEQSIRSLTGQTKEKRKTSVCSICSDAFDGRKKYVKLGKHIFMAKWWMKTQHKSRNRFAFTGSTTPQEMF